MNIVFDLGGVVVTWRPLALIARVFADPAVRETVRAEILDHPDWVGLDRGTVPLPDAIERGAARTGLSAAEVGEFFRQVPLSLQPIPETVDLMRRLKSRGHTLYCLSNMHVAAIHYLEATHTFWDVFTGRVISCRVGLVKPEPAIYEHLLRTFALEPTETVFIDDVDVNLAAAARFKIRTIQFADAAQCERDLAALEPA